MGAIGRKRGIGDRRYRALGWLAAVAILLTLAALLLPPPAGGGPQLSAYSGHWNDLSEMRRMAEETGLSSRSLLSGPRALLGADPQSSVLVIMGVERAYSAEERGAIEAFARAGGNLLVADDFGFGGILLEDLTGARIGLRTDCLRDIWFSKNPDFVEVRLRLNSTLGLPAVDILLNRPSALRMETPAPSPAIPGYRSNPEVVANASAHAWLDANGNLERDPDELERPYPVAAFYTMASGGRVLAVSDPGIFVNDMMGLAGNRQFVGSVLASLGRGRSTFIFDESRHSADGAAAGAGSAAVRAASAFQGNLAAIFLAFLASFLLSLYQFANLPDPAPRRHRDVLGDPRLWHFRTPAVSPDEFQRLRVAIVERVRLAYGMTPEEFYPAMLPRLGAMLSDPALGRFLEYESWPDVCAFGWALQRAESWAPPSEEAPRSPEAAWGAKTEYAEVEVVESAPEMLEVDGAVFGGSGGIRIWDPGNRRGGSDVDSILYGSREAAGARVPGAVSGGGGR